ncbi:hypothetical protein [Mucilaginibacter agri]|uniref:hypothetical protein n=1 Tax=Mucilaginibacter agri TaxID=2695265 RepID=UPI001FB58273|nr:hypothetical protein [Mucilaginibacter agri]
MKKIMKLAFLMSAIALVISACSASKNTVTGTPNVSRGKFTGTWTISTVTYESLVENAVQTVFDQGPPASFVGSTWNLTNSGNGTYTMSNGTAQKIFWSVNNATSNGQAFQFKKIYEGEKPKNVAEGYQLVVASNDGNTMVLKTPIAIGSTGTGYVVYTFAKK